MSNGPKMQYLKEGSRAALPIVLGYLPVGLAYGALAGGAGFTWLETVLMSILVFAGSAQFVTVAMWAGGADLFSIIATTFFVNLRHLLMSAALAPYFRGVSSAWLAWFGAELTDESFAIHSARLRQNPIGYQRPTMLVTNAVAHLGWIIASGLGHLLQSGIADPGRFGLDFALPAMFIALLLIQFTCKLDVVVAVVAFLVSIFLGQLIPGYWGAISAAISAALIGAVLVRRKGVAQ